MLSTKFKLPNNYYYIAALYLTTWLEFCTQVYSRYPVSISCFSCASEEYEPLYSRSENIYSFGQPMQFDKACDSPVDLENFSPTIRCDTSCITVLEPQFFGGILNEKNPYKFVRGCATDIFAVATAAAKEPHDREIGAGRSALRDDYDGGGRLPPTEIDFLHKADMCLSLPIQELWPELFTDSGGTRNTELVKVCACTTNIMPTVLQNIFRTTCILLLTTFWSAITLLKLLWEWWTYKDSSGRGFFTIRNRPKPSVLVEGPWQHGYLQLTKIRMHYVEAGNPSNPLMIMLHGFPEFWYSYRFQLKYFQKDYHVVALDLRGYGGTDKPTGVANYDTETLAGDVVEAIEKLGGKAILIGHDWGAALAWIVAMERPDVVADRLIILNVPHPKAFMKVVRTKSTQLLKSWYIFMFQCPMLAELRIKANDFAFLEHMFRSKMGGLVHPENFTDEDMEAWKYTFGTNNAVTPPLNYYRAGMMVAGRKHFSGEPVRPKTLIIWGAQDLALEVEGAMLSVPLCRDARLEIIEDASHWVQQDVPDKVNALIEQFIQQ